MGWPGEAEKIMSEAVVIAERNPGEDHFGGFWLARTHFAQVLVHTRPICRRQKGFSIRLLMLAQYRRSNWRGWRAP